MRKKLGRTVRPSGLRRLLFRAPIWFYRLGLGRLLGERFLLLNHVGRKSRRSRQTVLEVAGRDSETGAYLVASGFGRQSDWYRNILVTPKVTIRVGSKRLRAEAAPLCPGESGNAMIDYARRHPGAAKQLMRLCDFEVKGSEHEYYIIGHDYIPFVSLQPS